MYFAGHLFDLLLQHKLPNPVLRFLIQWYSEQRLQIQWRGTLFYFLYCGKWCTAGWDIAPYLAFTVYIDELMQQLSSLGISCHWKGQFAGCLCYADDLALLAPSAYALRRMLWYALSLLPKGIWCSMPAGKSQFICFHRHRFNVIALNFVGAFLIQIAI